MKKLCMTLYTLGWVFCVLLWFDRPGILVSIISCSPLLIDWFYGNFFFIMVIKLI